ncbi:MAG: phosphotransferase [Deltaproteobacteria bacterium]|nr:phosphotransferase [Deltaproteobacteria bacterium]
MTPPNLNRALGELYGEPLLSTEVIKLRGDASTRSYFRVRVADAPTGRPASIIAMLLPEDAFKSDEGGKQPDNQRLPFLEVAELLESKGLPVPSIYVEDLTNRIILLEDLGDLTFEQQLRRTPRSDWQRLYGAAVDLLADLHERCVDLPSASIVSQRSFDRELLDWELDHFRAWGLEALFGPLDAAQTATVAAGFSTLVHEIEAMPYGFVHRDYQSKNLMVGPGGALTLIDFQDAMLGPRVYDLVALLCDSYVSLDLDLQESMIERYAALRRIQPSALRREFWLVALHRKLKDAGRFIYIDRVRENPDFLQWYPQSLVYVGRALGQAPGFEALERLLRETIPGFPDAVAQPASSME